MATLTGSHLMNRAAYASGERIAPDGRHTPSLILQLINDSLQRYHRVKNELGHPHDVKRATATTSTSQAITNGWPAREYVALPADFLSLLGAQVLVNSGVRALRPFVETEEQLIWGWNDNAGTPEAYRIAVDTEGNKILRLLPAADAAYTIELVYLPTLTEITKDSSYTFVDGTENAVVADVAMQMLEATGIEEGSVYQALAARREDAYGALRHYAMQQARTGVVSPMNDRGSSRNRQRHHDHWLDRGT